MLKKLAILLLLVASTLSYADKFSPEASYKVCFTPGESCTDMIVSEINQAKKQILVEAYSFTSVPIAKALVQSYKRGVDTKIILDKSQFRSRGFSSAKFFSDYHVPVFIDYKPAIAHNKVMIIDGVTVITGSFNFTRAAQERNAENIIIISDPILAKKYLHNFDERLKQSESVIDNTSPFN